MSTPLPLSFAKSNYAAILILLIFWESSSVMAQAPTSLNYPSANVFIANVTSVNLSPTVSGSVASYGISPSLPAGLSFNTNTGVISGIPTVAIGATNYTITATNVSGFTTKVISIQVTNNYFDAGNNQVSFLGANSVAKVGNGQSAGNIVLYQNVITLSGTQIDCIVTTRTVNNASFSAYDQNSISDGSTYFNNDPAFFSPQFNFSGAGSVIYDFQYILGGSYNGTTNTGTNVILQNVKLNTYDIDGNGSATQYVEFGGFATSELGNPTTNEVVTFNTATALTRYTSNTSSNTASITDPKNRIRVSYTNMSDFSIVVGANGGGIAYYFLDFSVGSVAFTTTSTSAPTIDLNTSLPGVINGASGCGTGLAFTGSSQTNAGSSTNLQQLTVAFPTADIVDGANETLVLNGATSGGSIALNADASTTVTFASGSFTAARTSGSGVRTITFTSGTNITLARAEELLDALQYTNTASTPTAGNRRFTVNMRNTQFESPDAIFTATLNCVSISGNIYHDANGLTDNTVNANSTTGQFSANGVYALLVNPVNNQVILSQGISAGGAYSFGTATPGNYIIYVSGTNQTTGTVVNAATYPSGGYISTGENLGSGAGSDLLVDGKITITVGSVTAGNVNLGIQIPPVTTDATLSDQPNPGGFNNYTIPNGSFSATDADGTIASITITEFPTGANYLKIGTTVYTNPSGGVCPPLTTCTSWPGTVTINYSGGNPVSTISVDPSADVTSSVSIKYRVTDDGAAASNTSTLTIPFVVTNFFSASGNVWDDINGNGSRDGTEPLTNVAGSGEALYAMLVQNNNTYAGVPTVLATSSVSASTGYSFSNIPSGNNYTVRIVSQSSVPVSGSAASAVTPNLASGWTGVSVNNNGSITTGLNTNNPGISFTNLSASQSNANFGIEQPALADAKSYTVVGTSQQSTISIVDKQNSSITYTRSITMTGTASTGNTPGILTGTDPDGATGGSALAIQSGTAGVNLVIDPATYNATNSSSSVATMLMYNGIQLQSGGCKGSDIGNGFCSNYNSVTGKWEIPGYQANLLQILGVSGTTSLEFNYAWKDEASVTGAFNTYAMSFAFPLPLKLISFNAKATANQTVTLEWKTADENNTDRFEVEYSTNGVSFVKIGMVKAVGEGRGIYSFVHNDAPSDNNYYRLAMYDKDGKYKYSSIQLARMNIDPSLVHIYPNPAVGDHGEVTISWRSLVGSNADMVVRDHIGRQIYIGKLDASGKAVISVGGWAPGVYYIAVQKGNARSIIKLIVD